MSPLSQLLRLRAGDAAPRHAIPELSWAELADALLAAVERGCRVASYFGAAERKATRLYLVLADDDASELAVGSTLLSGGSFASLASECPQVHLFEREIAEQHGLIAVGHPRPGPVRCGGALAPRGIAQSGARRDAPGTTDFYRVDGEEVHEVGVGPVHAGVIEPGHFRFQCHGEEVLHLEIRLGYQHRGVERALAGGPGPRSMAHAETAAGDTTIGHGTAYCELHEALARTAVPPRGAALRTIALELERLANHVGDLGALAGDVAFLPTASWCGRLRGDFLNLTAELSGSRFGRGLVRPGGTAFDVDDDLVARLLDRLGVAADDARSAIELLWNSSSVMARFEGTGVVRRELAETLGLTGPTARASGVDRDVRRDHPRGAYRSRPIPVAGADSGDVFARAHVRWLEIEHSLEHVRQQLAALPPGPVRGTAGALRPLGIAVSLVEGWRGAICHVALTDDSGRFERYKIVDPSFQGWSALALAMRGQQISDFPLCNKSFNLSYCGHDL